MRTLLRWRLAYAVAVFLVAALACGQTDATTQSTTESDTATEMARPSPEPTPEVASPIGLRRTAEGYALVLANTAASPAGPFVCDVRLADGFTVTSVRLSAPSGPDVEVPFSELEGGIVRVRVQAGIDTVALLVLKAGR